MNAVGYEAYSGVEGSNRGENSGGIVPSLQGSFSIEHFVILILFFALATIILHALTGNRYGFHRDELATLDDARNLIRKSKLSQETVYAVLNGQPVRASTLAIFQQAIDG